MVYADKWMGYTPAMTLGPAIKAYRTAHRMTQTAFGDLFGAKQSAVSQWERGKSVPEWPILVRVAHTLGQSVETLVPVDEKKAQLGGPNLSREAVYSPVSEQFSPGGFSDAAVAAAYRAVSGQLALAAKRFTRLARECQSYADTLTAELGRHAAILSGSRSRSPRHSAKHHHRRRGGRRA